MFLAIRDLRFARGRFALMGVVIALLSLLVVMLSGLTAGLTAQSISAVRGLPADHIAFSRPTPGQDLSFTNSHLSPHQVRAWQHQPGVTTATPLSVQPTQVDVGDHRAAVTLFGIEPDSAAAPPHLRAGSVVVSEALAADGRVVISGSAYPVVGTVSDSSYNHTPVVWMARSDMHSTSTVLLLQTDDSVDVAAADRAVGTSTVTRSDAFSAVGAFSAENGSLTVMRVLLLAVGGLVVGAFFTVWTIQRRPDLAILKAIGGSSRYLVRDALGQALIVCVLGGSVGAGCAAAAGWALTGAVPFVVSASTVLFPLALIVALGMVGALVAVGRITSVDPLSALSGAH